MIYLPMKIQANIHQEIAHFSPLRIGDWKLVYILRSSIPRSSILTKLYLTRKCFCQCLCRSHSVTYSILQELLVSLEANSIEYTWYLSIRTTTPQPFYGPFSETTRVSRCQKKTSS